MRCLQRIYTILLGPLTERPVRDRSGHPLMDWMGQPYACGNPVPNVDSRGASVRGEVALVAPDGSGTATASVLYDSYGQARYAAAST
jgi:hypothetical protein